MGLDAIKAARAYVETFFDDGAAKGIKNLERQLDALGGKARSIGGSLMGLAAPVLGFGGLAVAQFTTAGSALDDMHQRTGIAVSTLSELAYAAQLSGTSIESLESGLVKQTKFLGDLQSGSRSAAGTLSQLGLGVEDLAGLKGDQAFAVLAEAVAGVDDEVLQTNLAMDIFGKGATDLLPMLKGGASGLDELRQQARDLGVVMSGDDASAAAAFGDQLDQLWSQLGAATNQVGAALVPALSQLLETIQPLLTSGIEWLSQNRDLVVTIGSVAAGVLAGGAALVGFGVAASAIAAGVTAGIVALLATTVDWSAGWQFLVDTLGESLGLAVQLISNGEIDLAMQLVWAQIQATWSQGVRWVVKTIGGLVTATIGALATGIDGLGSMLDAISARLAQYIASSGKLAQLLTQAINPAMSPGLKALTDNLFPEGTAEELLKMQEAGQVGKSSLHELAKSLEQAGDGFMELGSNVDELEQKLADLKRVSIDTNLKAELAKTQKATETPRAGGARPMTPQLDYSGGTLSGTFSGSASRMLFSSSGETKTIKALGEVSAAVEKVETAIRDAWGRVG